MREKYIEERFPRILEHGTYGDGDVNLTTVADHFDIKLTPEDAKKLMEYTDNIYNMFVKTVQAFDEAAPEAFNKFWYQQK